MSPITTTISISGLTCGHCVASVTEELEALEDVSNVTVELNKGGISRATIVSGNEFPPARLAEAVAEAGYLVVSGDA